MRTGAGGGVGRRRGPGAPRGNVPESAQAGHAPPASVLAGLCGCPASLAPRRIARRFLQPSGWAQGGHRITPCAAGRRGGVFGRRGRGRRPGARPRVDVLPVRAESGNPAVAPRPHGIETPAGDPREAAGPAPRWRLGRLMVARYASRSAGRGRGLRRGGRPAGIAQPRGETDRRKPADARPFLRAAPGGDHLPSRRQPVPSSVSRTWASRSAAVSHSMIHSPT